MNGDAEYRFDKVYYAAWGLAKTIPVNQYWAEVLGRLYEKIKDICYDLDSSVIERWNVVDKDEEKDKKRFLGSYESVRYGLYRILLNKVKYNIKEDIVKKYMANSDLACRAYAYAFCELTKKYILEGYGNYGLIACEYMMRNEHIWSSEEMRDALNGVCWNADSKYNSNYLDCANSFNAREEYWKRKMPKWFGFDDNKTPTNVGNVRALLQQNNSVQIENLKNQIEKIHLWMERKTSSVFERVLIIFISAGLGYWFFHGLK